MNLWLAFERVWAPEEVFLQREHGWRLEARAHPLALGRAHLRSRQPGASAFVRRVLRRRASLEDEGRGVPVPEEGEEAAGFVRLGEDRRST
jgi:hypothetical protein